MRQHDEPADTFAPADHRDAFANGRTCQYYGAPQPGGWRCGYRRFRRRHRPTARAVRVASPGERRPALFNATMTVLTLLDESGWLPRHCRAAGTAVAGRCRCYWHGLRQRTGRKRRSGTFTGGCGSRVTTVTVPGLAANTATSMAVPRHCWHAGRRPWRPCRRRSVVSPDGNAAWCCRLEQRC